MESYSRYKVLFLLQDGQVLGSPAKPRGTSNNRRNPAFSDQDQWVEIPGMQIWPWYQERPFDC